MFNVELEVKNIIEFIRDYFKKKNLKGVVLGISGGKDSAIVSGLFSMALGSENVLGVTLPCHSESTDKTDAKLVSDKFGFELIDLDLTPVYDSFIKEVNKLGNFTDEELKNSNINIKPRLRMSSVYYLAALYSAIKGGTYIVAGTSNKCELYVGYFTKGGDNSFDIGVINDYTVSEVIEIGKYIGVPEQVLYKTPSDGLSNMSDEDKLGVKYSDIEKYMNNEELDSEISKKILRLHNNSQHKFNTPIYKRIIK
jgi:NAD+ synthase